METLFQSRSLVKRASWLVRLRWLAIGVLITATLFAARVLNVSLPAFALYTLAAALLSYNLLLFILLNYITRKGCPHITTGGITTFQISADLFILATILHFSGGIENPFFLYFVFHMIIASTLLSKLQSYLQATLAVFLFGLLVLLENRGIIPHYPLTGFATGDLYRSGLFVFGTFSIFSTTLYLVVYMTTSISEQLRRQQDGYERANAMLREKDHLKNEYVMRLTHDIKGHLAAIQSCLAIVGDKMVGSLNEKQTDLFKRAYQRTEKCTAFVNALLAITRVRMAGRLEMEVFPLKNAISIAFASVEVKASDKSINMSYDIEPAVGQIYGEPFLIEQTITDLLLNAVKYTPANGTVKLSAKDAGDCVLVQISDTGIGIPQDEIGRIFEEFYRAGNARKVERDGTGLGLSLAKEVVERHGGRIWAQNNPTGGSTFSFTLLKTSGKSDDRQGKII